MKEPKSRDYRVTWKQDDPASENFGKLVTTNVHCEVGKAKEFWEKHSRSKVVKVRMTYPQIKP